MNPQDESKLQLNKAKEFLKRLLDLVDTDGVKAIPLVYLPPAEQLRRKANELEEQEKLIKEIKKFLKSNY